MDFNGRVSQLAVKIENSTFQILIIYAPNPETQEERESFMNDVQYYHDPALPAVICGDFNIRVSLEDFIVAVILAATQ